MGSTTRPREILSANVAQSLRNQLAKNNVADFIVVAEKVSEVLGAPDGGEFRRWLRESVGKLELNDRCVIDAIHVLGTPVATTTTTCSHADDP